MTSINFAFTSGSDFTNGYSAHVQDVTNASSGVADANGVRTWKWDTKDTSNPVNHFFSGTGYVFKFTEGTTTSNGVWEDYAGNVGTRNGSVISFGTSRTFTDTSAFSGGVVPTSGGTSGNAGVGFTASFYDVTENSFSYEVTHTSGFTSDQTYELHSTTMTPTFISDIVVGAASGSTNSRSHTWATPDVIQVRDAYGTIGADLTLSNNNKKVFCNFW